MGQRGLMLNERHPTTSVWPVSWNISAYNIALYNLNQYLYELFFFYLFLYEPQYNIIWKRWTWRSFNPRYYKFDNIKLNSQLVHLSLPVYKIFRYNQWVLILLILTKNYSPQPKKITHTTLYTWTKLFDKKIN